MILCIRDRSLKAVLLVLACTLTNPIFASQTTKTHASSKPKAVPAKTPPAPQEISFLTSLQPKYASIFLELGAFGASQGNAQGVRINGLIGDYFTVKHHYSQNVLLGLGYYINGLQNNLITVLYGLNIFLFPSTTVKGNIVQEQLFTNLSYKYSITNVPIYAGVKAFLNTGSTRFNVTIDAGVGPNTIHTGDIKETSIESSTLPDQSTFSGETSVAFSAMLGVGVRFNNVYRNHPLEVNYRFFYLGQSNFNTVNNQITSTLRTGNSFANALFFTFKL